MDSQQAREILSAYRPGRGEETDPQIAEALAQARRDPELGRWLEQQHEFDAVIAAKLQQVPVPVGLKTRILAEQKIIRPQIRWFQPAYLAAAAVVVIAATGALLGMRWYEQRPFNDYREHMVAFVSRKYRMNVESKDLEKLRETFAARGWPSDYVVPRSLQSLPLLGGMIIEWKSHKVSLICWGVEGDDSKSAWLFITDPAGLPWVPGPAVPATGRVDGFRTKSWTKDGRLYVMAGPAGTVSSLTDF
jgi:hypothetical protein